MNPPIDEEAIYEGWDFIQRIIVSLHQKNINQSDLVAKLSRSAPSDKSLKALSEFDRLLKAIYILEYVDDSDLRRYIQTALNRGEAYHQLQRAFEKTGGKKGIRAKTDVEIDMWYECSRLMANCVIYFNSVGLNALLQSYELNGDVKNIKRLAHTSPVAWEHIIMSGKYLFDHLQEDIPDITVLMEGMLRAA